MWLWLHSDVLTQELSTTPSEVKLGWPTQLFHGDLSKRNHSLLLTNRSGETFHKGVQSSTGVLLSWDDLLQRLLVFPPLASLLLLYALLYSYIHSCAAMQRTVVSQWSVCC